MPLTRGEKEAVVAEIGQLIEDSKIVVMATYSGSAVKDLQNLRRTAKENGTQLKIVKNRLFKRALAGNEKLGSIDTSLLTGQLIYGFNAQDEAAPAQSLAQFTKINPEVQFVGAITEEGQLLSSDDVKMLAQLPDKQQLRAQLVGTLQAPSQSFVSVLSGNLRSVINVLNAQAQSIN